MYIIELRRSFEHLERSQIDQTDMIIYTVSNLYVIRAFKNDTVYLYHS